MCVCVCVCVCVWCVCVYIFACACVHVWECGTLYVEPNAINTGTWLISSPQLTDHEITPECDDILMSPGENGDIEALVFQV